MIDHFVLSNGDIEKYDYNGLENKPESDDTLSVEGGFADAKKVGEELARLEALITGNNQSS